ncbi:MAG: hypothetical protein RR191_05850 [Cetobacterium sp.]|uniref:hypothetical protein n=1 Tax=unclassified Cetobacterium TaxID=2630983 RepID=UPI00163CBE65|nr:hypothetical protein [Cetobacterium sp. 2A]MBC2856134.1 hypothetical protein [Cetobacterium sp. 2A]
MKSSKKITELKREELITFKSDEEYFKNCKNGSKLETTREFDLDDARFTRLLGWKKSKDEKDRMFVQFTNKNKPEDQFVVEVIGVEKYNTLCKIKFKHIQELEELQIS